jgi:glutaredoxin
MFNRYEWNLVEGNGSPEKLTLLSLSTCGYCHSARQYLEDRELSFRYLELDMIPPEDKEELKKEFQAGFGRPVYFTTLVIKQDRFVTGIIKIQLGEEN